MECFFYYYYLLMCAQLILLPVLMSVDTIACSQILNEFSECFSVLLWVCIFLMLKLTLQAGQKEHARVLSAASLFFY